MSRANPWGTGVHLPFRIASDGVAIARGAEKVEQALRMLLRTQHGERLMRPSYGANLRSLAFRPVDSATCREAERLCRDAIAKWEPRVRLTSVNASPARTESACGLAIELRYELAGDPVEYSLQLLSSLEEAT